MNEQSTRQLPRQVLLFSGHMLDAPGRPQPRFPPAKEAAAAEALEQLLAQVDAGPADLAICSGACGGDLLFAECAAARGVAREVYLPFDAATFAAGSVDYAGGSWPARYTALLADCKLHMLPAERGPLPAGADPYVETNLWMLAQARRYGAERVVFMCLWDGRGGDGPGGTQHMMQEVAQRKGRSLRIDTADL